MFQLFAMRLALFRPPLNLISGLRECGLHLDLGGYYPYWQHLRES